ncbi:MAG: hypothetical protein AABW65_01430 [Nanoarchaeota archaeon]
MTRKQIFVIIAVLLILGIILKVFIFNSSYTNIDYKESEVKNLTKKNVSEEKNFCSGKSRDGDFCIQIYEPVCGWYSLGTSKTFGNSCFACLDKSVSYWIEGECGN